MYRGEVIMARESQIVKKGAAVFEVGACDVHAGLQLFGDGALFAIHRAGLRCLFSRQNYPSDRWQFSQVK